MVKTLPFGRIQVPIPGFGAMGLSSAMGSNLSLEEAEPVLSKAIEVGCTFWDTAVRSLSALVLGCAANSTHQVAYRAGANERLLGDFIQKHGVRDQLFG